IALDLVYNLPYLPRRMFRSHSRGFPMLVIPGQPGKDLCDPHLKLSRRALLRVGGSGLLGATLGGMFQMQAKAQEQGRAGGAGWGKAKSIIMCYLQGGPSHLDLWDP